MTRVRTGLAEILKIGLERSHTILKNRTSHPHQGVDNINEKLGIGGGLGLAKTDIATVNNCAVHTGAM